ncbi:MAG: hypothetical protein V1921_01210 [Candidatus Altiarchaeota archaeon]
MVKTYENFPVWMVLVTNAVALSVYALGAAILYGFGTGIVVLYLLYCLWVETRVMRMSCACCYYYGKTCGSGKGRLCALLFKKSDPKRFLEKDITFKDLLPDFMVSLLPLVGGLTLLAAGFTWSILALMTALALLAFPGSAVMRGRIMCKYCRQREIGCPAQKLFQKKEANTI